MIGHRTRAIFDLDSTVLTVYGRQERAEVGYNPEKRGRPSYLPLLCFEGNMQDCWEVATVLGLSPEKRHPHVLKHSLASHLVAGNVNLALIKQSLGHRSISSTMVYVGTTDAQAVQAALMGLF